MCVSLFCGGGNLGDFTVSDGFYRALSENTCLFAYMCPKQSNPTFHPNYTDHYERKLCGIKIPCLRTNPFSTCSGQFFVNFISMQEKLTSVSAEQGQVKIPVLKTISTLYIKTCSSDTNLIWKVSFLFVIVVYCPSSQLFLPM